MANLTSLVIIDLQQQCSEKAEDPSTLKDDDALEAIGVRSITNHNRRKI